MKTKACLYCAEAIPESELKCHYCGEDQRVSPARHGPSSNAINGPPCPNCGERDLRSGPWPWYLGTIGALLVRAVICNRCEHQFDANKPQADLQKRKRNLAILLNGIGGLGIVAIIGGLVALIMSI